MLQFKTEIDKLKEKNLDFDQMRLKIFTIKCMHLQRLY